MVLMEVMIITAHAVRTSVPVESARRFGLQWRQRDCSRRGAVQGGLIGRAWCQDSRKPTFPGAGRAWHQPSRKDLHRSCAAEWL